MTVARAWTVAEEDQGRRLDQFLTDQLAGEYTRSHIQSWIIIGFVQVNGKTITKTGCKLRAGEPIALTIPDPVPDLALPEDLPLEILYEDEWLAVVNKPVGMSVHPSASSRTGTLVNALLHHLKNLSGIGGVFRPGIVHRLDKVTSGLLVVAKDDHTHVALSQQFRAREVKKHYLAIVQGWLKTGHIVVDQPITRHAVERQRFTVNPQGRPAVTRIEVAEPLRGHALLDLFPETGRTHQLRVHLASLGHPIVLDKLYGYRLSPEWRLRIGDLLTAYKGIFLHAHELTFIHPSTEAEMHFTIAPPPRFQQLLAALRKP